MYCSVRKVMLFIFTYQDGDTDDCLYYDTLTNLWTPGAPMNEPRYIAAYTVTSRGLMVFGTTA